MIHINLGFSELVQMATGANTTPLGRLNPAMVGSTKSTLFGQSLLKPSYMSTSNMAATNVPISFAGMLPQSTNSPSAPKREIDHDSSSNGKNTVSFSSIQFEFHSC